MRKIQFFIIVEVILIVMGLMTIMANNLSSFILILVLILLALRFYNQDKRNNFLLTIGLVLLFMIFMLNPYIIMAVVLGVVYIVINHFSQVKKKNRYALVRFREEELKAKPVRNQWFGMDTHDSDFYAFDDINIIRLTGSDTIDLSNIIVTGKDNVVVIRKILGPTKILVPIDVAVKLDVSAIYGSVRYFDFEEYDLRNESLKIWHSEDEEYLKAVKIIVSTLAGDVEVVRK
ncbi:MULTISPECIES: cell wall-active antibiotics response protein LiaF [Streptococcus]|uniref:Cell wall-active antibiotics response protein LiaF n=2 Tax=Streptococcus TaxID=1301 RepID=A0A2G3P032_STRMC|nr:MULTISPECIES: cell wall-active antibiotics response protein LiaF [Streptococcus]CCF01753.1 Transporter associated with VraSR [Streptococcus macedonicus ACA-DC 198]ALT81359.1 transporter [Streptococcus gallolyticus]KEH52855.1 transporter [Streptococcus macedonicus]MBT0896506.1 transporter [Streptococcus infantarius subsp. infantarius]MBT1048320.1 transporter [Streptococcus macedonicus]